jgi:hypothetical protein
MTTSAMPVSYKKPTATEARSAPVAAPPLAFAFRGDVESVTDKSPQLVPLLPEAREHVARVFGSDAPVVLAVVENSEAADSLPELFVYIQTLSPVPAARDKLEPLDQEWLVGHPAVL